MIPDYWIKFMDENNLRDVMCEIPEEADLSELDGGSIEIFKEEEIIDEATNYYPGIGVVKDGYIPVASCSHGTGDPYFINIKDGKAGKLYRVYHDAVFDGKYNKEEAINVVLNNYEDLLKYKST
ncbi:MAG: hypothetical protein GY931_08715 [Maribacter sp.]|nr:hypothetical protein [Maribacter sp.]